MKRTLRILGLAILPLFGFGLGIIAGFDVAPARAGGICPTTGVNTYVTSNEEGDTVYQWSLGTGRPTVVRYNYQTGEGVRRELKVSDSRPGGEAPLAPAGGEIPEIVISGVIWTPDPVNRVAIINGRRVEEGGVFETRTGRKFRVEEIKKSGEVDYKEIE